MIIATFLTDGDLVYLIRDNTCTWEFPLGNMGVPGDLQEIKSVLLNKSIPASVYFGFDNFIFNSVVYNIFFYKTLRFKYIPQGYNASSWVKLSGLKKYNLDPALKSRIPVFIGFIYNSISTQSKSVWLRDHSVPTSVAQLF